MYMFHLDTLLLEFALNKWQSKQYKCSKFWKNTFNDGLLALSTLSLKLVIHHMTHCYSRVDVRYLAWLLLHEQDFDPKMNFGFDATQSIHLPLALWDLSLPIAGKDDIGSTRLASMMQHLRSYCNGHGCPQVPKKRLL